MLYFGLVQGDITAEFINCLYQSPAVGVYYRCSTLSLQILMSILNIVDELIQVLNDKNPDLKPKDEFKDKHPNYRKFSADPLAPLNAADIVKPKKT